MWCGPERVPAGAVSRGLLRPPPGGRPGAGRSRRLLSGCCDRPEAVAWSWRDVLGEAGSAGEGESK